MLNGADTKERYRIKGAGCTRYPTQPLYQRAHHRDLGCAQPPWRRRHGHQAGCGLTIHRQDNRRPGFSNADLGPAAAMA